MGYDTKIKKYFSGLNTIYIGDNLEGGSDPRREGIAIGGQQHKQKGMIKNKHESIRIYQSLS